VKCLECLGICKTHTPRSGHRTLEASDTKCIHCRRLDRVLSPHLLTNLAPFIACPTNARSIPLPGHLVRSISCLPISLHAPSQAGYLYLSNVIIMMETLDVKVCVSTFIFIIWQLHSRTSSSTPTDELVQNLRRELLSLRLQTI